MTVQKAAKPPVDPNTKIPAAVKAAAAKAAEIHKAAYNPTDPAAPTPGAPTPEPAATTATPAPAPVEAAPAAPAAPAPAPAPVPPPTPPADWEHRFNSMRGRYEAERSKRESLEQTLAAMTQPAPAADPQMSASSLLTPQERGEYGDELISVMQRAAEEKFAPIISELKNQVGNLTTQLTNVGQAQAAEKRAEMNTTLSREIPNWLEINNDPKFLDWLALPDTYSGAIRHDLLKAAHAANDTPRVLAFFKGFLAEEAAIAPPAPAPDLTPAAPPAPQIKLADLAAPGRAKSAAPPPGPAEKPSFTRAQVTQFYVDVARGRYRGRDEERQRLDREISEAGREGRIR